MVCRGSANGHRERGGWSECRGWVDEVIAGTRVDAVNTGRWVAAAGWVGKYKGWGGEVDAVDAGRWDGSTSCTCPQGHAVSVVRMWLIHMSSMLMLLISYDM